VEGDGSELWISAHRPDSHKFLHPSLSRSLDQLDAHQRVIIKKLPRMILVGANSTDYRGEMDDDVLAGHRCATSIEPAQIILRRRGRRNLTAWNSMPFPGPQHMLA
jgi:hypothetical protein